MVSKWPEKEYYDLVIKEKDFWIYWNNSCYENSDQVIIGKNKEFGRRKRNAWKLNRII
jgi:hypothetical protein